jgi:predicted DNA-binding protein
VANTKDPLSLRFKPEFHERIQKAADRLKLPKHTLCQMAIEAAVEAIEEHGQLTLPVQFKITKAR